jgi:DNA-binding NarL/FixJ family response regulator
VSVSVLIVDDQTSFLGVAADLLRSRGFDVVGTAANSVDAITYAERLQPDAVLLDVHLGAEDVMDTLASLISLPNPPRVLLTSTDSGAVTSDLARRHGAVGFVCKSDLADADLAQFFSP